MHGKFFLSCAFFEAFSLADSNKEAFGSLAELILRTKKVKSTCLTVKYNYYVAKGPHACQWIAKFTHAVSRICSATLVCNIIAVHGWWMYHNITHIIPSKARFLLVLCWFSVWFPWEVSRPTTLSFFKTIVTQARPLLEHQPGFLLLYSLSRL